MTKSNEHSDAMREIIVAAKRAYTDATGDYPSDIGMTQAIEAAIAHERLTADREADMQGLWRVIEGQRATIAEARDFICLAKNTGSDSYLDKALALLDLRS